MNRPSTTHEPAVGAASEQDHAELPAPLDAQTAILLQFQNLMGQFLQTQDAVMSAYFQALGHQNGNGTRVAPNALPVVVQAPRPANLAPLPRVIAPARAPLVAVAPHAVESATPARATRPIDAAPRHETPAAPARAESVAPAAPAPRAETVDRPAPPSARTASERPDPVSRLLQIVGERTGYPLDMLNLDSNIEADLGIDSIKRVEILSTFQRQCSADERPRLQAAMEKISSLKTLRETAEALAGVLSAAGEEAVAS